MIYIFFDIDGTLTKERTSWKKLHERAGTWGDSRKYYEEWLDHQNADRWFRQDLALLNRSQLTPQMVEESLFNYQFFNGVTDFFNAMLEQFSADVKIVLISGGFGPFVEKVANDLNVPLSNVIYHRVEYDDVTKAYIPDPLVTFEDKKQAITRFIDADMTNNVHYDEYPYIIAIGNGLNDIDMFEMANIAIGFNIDNSEAPIIDKYLDMKFLKDFRFLSEYLLCAWKR